MSQKEEIIRSLSSDVLWVEHKKNLEREIRELFNEKNINKIIELWKIDVQLVRARENCKFILKFYVKQWKKSHISSLVCVY